MKWPILPPKNSLQRHLSLGLAIGVTGLWLLATVGAGLIIRHEIDEVFDSALREVAQRVLPLAYIEVLDRDTAAPPDEVPAQRIASVSAHEEYITYIVRDAKGRVLLQSHDADPTAFPNDLTPGSTIAPIFASTPKAPFRARCLSLRPNGRAIAARRWSRRWGCSFGHSRLCSHSACSAFGPWCACLCDPSWPCRAKSNRAAEATLPPLELRGFRQKSVRWPML